MKTTTTDRKITNQKMNEYNSHSLRSYIPSFFHFFIFSLLIISCKPTPKNSFEAALQKAGKNRTELEKVIEHYRQNPADSLKLKAAYFLIGNMPGFCYYQGKLIDDYYQYFDIVAKLKKQRPAISFTDLTQIGDSISGVYGTFSTDKVDKFYDLQQVNSAYLISNIDMAFKVWLEQPWGKDITFDQFCEYILPYHIANENPFGYDRPGIYNQYNIILDSVRRVKGDAVAACIKINNKLISEGWTWADGIEELPHFGAKTLLEKRVGVCREYADIAAYTMRATGIPVAIDFTPQWPFRNMGHTFNVVLTKQGKNIPFMGVESNPGIPHKADHKKAKMYRNTFAIQPQSLAMIAGKNDIIPPLFQNPRFIDVSDEYFQGVDVTVPLKKTEKRDKYAYICVFNNQSWVPIHWGKIEKGSVVFTKMGRDIVYLPVSYREEGLVPATLPFLLTKEGTVKYLNPDFSNKQSMKLTRKYPVLTVGWRLERMVGGRFQGANQSNFKDSVNLHVIDTLPEVFYQSKSITIDKAFRYLRYLAPKDSHGNIAELEFYGENDSIHPLKGKIIGDDRYMDKDHGKEKAMDGDISTFFDAYWKDNAWVGIDLGTKQKVKKIRFIPVNDDNNIAPGSDYELFYFEENKGWVSAGRQTAKTFELVFDNVPLGALYLLHNYTAGREERIFTYENGKQVWW
jgi:hypothetical protein